MPALAAAYPSELEAHVRLPDGLELFLRPIRADDDGALRDLLANMSAEDRRLRFFAPIQRLSDALAWRLTHVDYEHSIALIAFAGEPPAAWGVIRLAAEPGAPEAEFAVALRSDVKGRGLGRLLMRQVCSLAARIGVTEIFGHVLRDNQPMLHLAREMGFAVTADPDMPEAVQVRRRMAPPPA